MTTPLLKFCGGKTKLLPELVKRMPARYGRYFEPFAGGAALFFHLEPTSAVIGDANADLIDTYRAVAEDPEAVIADLADLSIPHTAEHYYEIRNAFNSHIGRRAAQFLYLNRTCFNGLWRVNRAGEFNVPMGTYKNPLAGMPARIRAAAKALDRCERHAGDYRVTLAALRRGDFAYIDSPYDGTWCNYTADGFAADAQAQLAKTVRSLVRRGVMVMASNADTPRVRVLYADWRVDTVRCKRSVNSDGSGRGEVNEVIVMAGYEPAMRKAA